MTDATLAELLRCPLCRAALSLDDQQARCAGHAFPVERGIPRLLPPDLMRLREGRSVDDVRARTYRSFAFEWQRFSDQLAAYERNFHWYLEPLASSSLRGRIVLDAGCGMGRHTFHFLRQGARVVALDASEAIDAAARNNPSGSALFVQGDVLQLPVASASFDLACCLGVLHHVEDTAGGLRQLVGAVRPGGWILIFLYHDPSELGWARRALLRLVSVARRITTRLPHRLLHGLTWLLAASLFLLYVGPLRLISRIPGLAKLRSLPLGQYTDYPFRVLWNDQFDRFSAPLEKRYRRAEVEALLRDAGLIDLRILGGYGWRAAGKKPDWA